MQDESYSEAQAESQIVDHGTGELDPPPGQLILGLDLPALTQRKGQTDGMTRANALYAVTRAIDGLREGDRISAAMKDGRVVVKVVESWR